MESDIDDQVLALLQDKGLHFEVRGKGVDFMSLEQFNMGFSQATSFAGCGPDSNTFYYRQRENPDLILRIMIKSGLLFARLAPYDTFEAELSLRLSGKEKTTATT